MNLPPYNPLDKVNLARSIEGELLSRRPEPLSAVDEIKGAGIYVIYYAGQFGPYGAIRCDAQNDVFHTPIYVGKAIPKGGRKGGLTKDSGRSTALRDRLKQHAASVDEAGNLELADFWVRHLVVDDIWIPLGENMLIETFQPVWNRAIDGFGNKDPGRRRANQFRSPWDILHRGRLFANKLAESGLTTDFLTQRVADYFAGRPLKKLPRKVEEALEEDKRLAEEAADEADF
ncbi:MAG TPA: Eco29kI family restriction endonuclease [Allosphingosinicella sp.]|nr:Eco29kI family restriction endonuclease [Allosphingosinicella sp.]